MTQLLRDKGDKSIMAQVLNIPVTCHPDHFPADKYEYHSYEQNYTAPIVGAERMWFFWDNYLPNREADPRASPLIAKSLDNLPPARTL
jgi:acetyl esterase/lipase